MGKGSAKCGEEGFAEQLQAAMKLHQDGELESAERAYRELLEAYPEQPDAMHFLGVLCHQQGDSREALKLITTAITKIPRHADAHNNLGNIFRELDELPLAEACYRTSIDCAPDHFNARLNLATVLDLQDKAAAAFKVYAPLVEEAPKFGKAQYMFGLFLRNRAQSMEHLEQSAKCLRAAYDLDPEDPLFANELAMALYLLQRPQEAVTIYQAGLERDPDNASLRHMLAACGGAPAPARAADAYVERMFDSFADHFDEQLLHTLKYRAPELVVKALSERLDGRSGLAVLDMGCGTGLCGPQIRPSAGRLVGMDLSAAMLEKAKARGCYDQLDKDEITRYLQASGESFDVILSADTLVYFGALHAVARAAYGRLRGGGWLGFSVEAEDCDHDHVALAPSGRYQHSAAHVEACLAGAGFRNASLLRDTLRFERGTPVEGWIVVAQR